MSPVGTNELSTSVPPLLSVNQPSNDWLSSSLVGVGNSPISFPAVTVIDEGLTFPPFAFNVTVYSATSS